MKKLLFFLLIGGFILTSCNKYPRDGQPETYIEVVGSAEMEVEPDEIHLTVVIGNVSEKYQSGTVKELLSLDAADENLMDVLAKVGIKKEQVFLNDAVTTNYWYLRYGRFVDNMRLEKRYNVVLDGVAQLNSLLAELPGPKEGIVSVDVTELKNKNIEEHRKETKKMAMKAAKDKASYLLESIGAKVGKPVYIKEGYDNDSDIQGGKALSNMIIQESKMEYSSEMMNGTPQMKKIKLRYEIEAKFEIL